ncbi:MAG: rhomboid family intramembrane serine protease [Proteobacteria bacterium]|nr:rhomboid family intramembrane serine protease [Pseudomonadota bacterium]
MQHQTYPLDKPENKVTEDGQKTFTHESDTLSSDQVSIENDDSFQLTPEDFLPTPKPSPKGFELYPEAGAAWVANLMLAFIFLGSILHWSTSSGSQSLFTASRFAVLENGEYWRLLTALGGHGDVMHFLHNAPIFWFFGWLLNAYFGWFSSLVLSTFVGVLSNLMTVWFYDARVQLLGASGMVYGMVAMWLVLYIHFDQKGSWPKRVIRSFGFALLVLFPQTYEHNVSYLAHASGFAIGVAVAILFIPFAKSRAPVFNSSYYL